MYLLPDFSPELYSKTKKKWAASNLSQPYLLKISTHCTPQLRNRQVDTLNSFSQKTKDLYNFPILACAINMKNVNDVYLATEIIWHISILPCFLILFHAM